LFGDWTGVGVGRARMPTCTNHVAEGLTVLEVTPSRAESARRIAAVAAGRCRRPVLVLGIEGTSGPTRPASARGRRPGHGRPRAKRAVWRGQWRDAKGFRCSLMEGDRIGHVLRWQQVQTEEQLGEARKQGKAAGVIPEDQGRLCVVADGAAWIWKHGKGLCSHACQVLDAAPCAEDLQGVAQVQDGAS
jgi:hypothetical protein